MVGLVRCFVEYEDGDQGWARWTKAGWEEYECDDEPIIVAETESSLNAKGQLRGGGKGNSTEFEELLAARFKAAWLLQFDPTAVQFDDRLKELDIVPADQQSAAHDQETVHQLLPRFEAPFLPTDQPTAEPSVEPLVPLSDTPEPSALPSGEKLSVLESPGDLSQDTPGRSLCGLSSATTPLVAVSQDGSRQPGAHGSARLERSVLDSPDNMDVDSSLGCPTAHATSAGMPVHTRPVLKPADSDMQLVDSTFDSSVDCAQFESACSLVLPADVEPPDSEMMVVDSRLDPLAALDEESAGSRDGMISSDMVVVPPDLSVDVPDLSADSAGALLAEPVPHESSERPAVLLPQDASTYADEITDVPVGPLLDPEMPETASGMSVNKQALLEAERQAVVEWIMAVRKLHARLWRDGKQICDTLKPALAAAFGYLREQAKAKQAGFILRNFEVFAPFVALENRSRSGPLCKQLRKLHSSFAPSNRSLDNTIPVPDSQPDCLVGGQIRHYQLKGLQWLVTQHNAAACSILGDEMGLGKTLQTVAFVSYLKEVAEIRGPHLIVAPVSVLSSWRSEFAKWCPSVAVATLHGHPQERNKLKYQILTGQLLPNVLITSYEMLSLETAFLSNVGWYYLIFDEAQVSGSGLFCCHRQTCLP